MVFIMQNTKYKVRFNLIKHFYITHEKNAQNNKNSSNLTLNSLQFYLLALKFTFTSKLMSKTIHVLWRSTSIKLARGNFPLHRSSSKKHYFAIIVDTTSFWWACNGYTPRFVPSEISQCLIVTGAYETPRVYDTSCCQRCARIFAWQCALR